MTKNGKKILVLVSLLVATGALAQGGGHKKAAPKPYEYGNVLMNKYAEENKIAPVVFKHWTHRGRYTCRLCHIDLGFAMEANGTGVKEEDNAAGLYCGACHNGKEAFAPKTGTGRTVDHCDRCHSVGEDKDAEKRFDEFVKGFPRTRFGNKVDWMKAEEAGMIKPKSQIEGVGGKTKELAMPSDQEIKAGLQGMPEIIFSHKKHTVWNGCQVCHPDVFGVKKGSTVYQMQDIFEGKYCGVCHGKVAFPNQDCAACHTKEVG